MKFMRIVCVLIAGCIAAGCETNQTRIGEGAGMGGLLGAAAGGIIGHQSDNGVTGALVGGAVGAAGGALIGSQMEKPNRTTTSTTSTTKVRKVTVQQVVDWTKDGLSSDQIIASIQSTHSTYALTTEDIDYLRRNGVSQRVIESMQTK
jgi:uncharacterized protein YcfJ